jgi:hypothetical protein
VDWTGTVTAVSSAAVAAVGIIHELRPPKKRSRSRKKTERRVDPIESLPDMVRYAREAERMRLSDQLFGLGTGLSLGAVVAGVVFAGAPPTNGLSKFGLFSLPVIALALILYSWTTPSRRREDWKWFRSRHRELLDRNTASRQDPSPKNEGPG